MNTWKTTDGPADFGWTSAWAKELGRWLEATTPGRGGAQPFPVRVTAQHRGRYRIAGCDGAGEAVPSGRLRRAGERPVVGDWVMVRSVAGEQGVIVGVLPRRGALLRRRPQGNARHELDGGAQLLAANVDLALIAVSAPEPLNVRRLERFLALAWDGGAAPVVLLTKLDACLQPDAVIAAARDAAPGTAVLALSAVTGAGLAQLRELLEPRRTAVILGPSGAGKSTLTNALLGSEQFRVAAVRADGRGRHTTTHRELVRLPGGALLIDTPGLREVGLWEAADGVRTAFEEIAALACTCRFRDCTHRSEPGCAVLDAVAAGALHADRLAAWHRLQRELHHATRRDDRRAAAEHHAHTKSAQRAYRQELKRRRGSS